MRPSKTCASVGGGGPRTSLKPLSMLRASPVTPFSVSVITCGRKMEGLNIVCQSVRHALPMSPLFSVYVITCSTLNPKTQGIRHCIPLHWLAADLRSDPPWSELQLLVTVGFMG